jgi:hypothetical protein
MPTEAGQQRLSESQVAFVSFIEQMFWTTNQIPTDEKCSEAVGVTLTTIKNYWQSSLVREHLVARGVNLSANNDGLLTAQQLMLANMLLNIHDKKSIREKLQECNVTPQKYQGWLNDPKFSGYLRTRAESLFAANDFQAYQALSDLANSGDGTGLKLFFEMRGIYNPRVKVDVNLEIVLTKIVEVIQRHVKDPVILAAIGEDLQNLDEVGGGQISGVQVGGVTPMAIEASHGSFTL